MAGLGRTLRRFNRWLNDTPERALEQAYDAALKINALENQHFEGKTITNQTGKYSETAFALIQADLNQYLQTVDIRLKEFKASRSIVNSTNSAKKSLNLPTDSNALEGFDQNAIVLEKLSFIDAVLARYKSGQSTFVALVPTSSLTTTSLPTPSGGGGKLPDWYSDATDPNDDDGLLDRTGVLPRSITTSLNRIKQELDPNSEQRVVQSFRSTQTKTRIAIRFLLLIIALPLLAQQISKPLIVGPIVDHFRHPDRAQIFLNAELREEALRELKLFEEELRFENLLGRLALPELQAPELRSQSNQPPSLGTSQAGSKATPKASQPSPSPEAKEAQESTSEPLRTGTEPILSLEERLKEKAEELAKEYGSRGSDAVKNIFADLVGFLTFGTFIITRHQDFEVLKSFVDERVYGLSDSAKAFIIILFTDVFVGFHSPHGWEVLLESICGHLGIPSNRSFNGLFIATFPVILDTIFKYWIFRYLNRISPSAVATYKNMNE